MQNILNLQKKKRSLAKFTLDTGTSGSGDAFSGGLEVSTVFFPSHNDTSCLKALEQGKWISGRLIACHDDRI